MRYQWNVVITAQYESLNANWGGWKISNFALLGGGCGGEKFSK